MLNISFISIHPEFIEAYFRFGVFRRAVEMSLIKVNNINLRDFAVDDRGSIDAKPYGGGDSMVLRPEPLVAAIESISDSNRHVILTSPGGCKWTHASAEVLSQTEKHLVFICARFAGVDQRFIDKYVDEEISLGEFVVSGGELPSLMLADSILRLIPGSLGNEESARIESFSAALEGRIEYPLYTRPPVFEGAEVPPILMTGDHQKISRWREEKTSDPRL